MCERHGAFWRIQEPIKCEDESSSSDPEPETSDADENIDCTELSNFGDQTNLLSASNLSYLSQHYGKYSHRLRKSPSPGSDDSLSDHNSSSSTPAPSKLSALEFSVFWTAGDRSVRIHLNRVILKNSKIIKTRELLLKIQFLCKHPDSIEERRHDSLNIGNNVCHEVHTRLLKTSREQILEEYVDVGVVEEVERYTLQIVVCERRQVVCGEVLWKGTLPLSCLYSGVDNALCLILNPQPREQKGEMVLSLCYVPTAEKLSIGLIEYKSYSRCRAYRTDDIATGFYIKVSVKYKGQVKHKRKTKVKSINSPILFNETFAFDVPQSQVENISIILSFKQHLKLEDGILTDVTIGKSVLGIGAESDAAHIHWRHMVANCHKPVLQWQPIW